MAGKLLGAITRANAETGGRYRIRGTASKQGVVGVYRVLLLIRKPLTLLAELWSAEDGSYEFSCLAYRYRGYVVIEHDDSDEPLNACIYDFVTPEPMP